MDGIFSAFAAHLRFKNWPNTKVTFVPHSTFQTLKWEEKKEIFNENSEVYLLDYVGPKSFIPQLSKFVKKIVLIDHHKTAQIYLDEWKNTNLVIPNCKLFFIIYYFIFLFFIILFFLLFFIFYYFIFYYFFLLFFLFFYLLFFFLFLF